MISKEPWGIVVLGNWKECLPELILNHSEIISGNSVRVILVKYNQRTKY